MRAAPLRLGRTWLYRATEGWLQKVDLGPDAHCVRRGPDAHAQCRVCLDVKYRVEPSGGLFLLFIMKGRDKSTHEATVTKAILFAIQGGVKGFKHLFAIPISASPRN